jgi:two-component system OmpR family response regulator
MKKILIVDDEPDLAEMLQCYLTEKGFECFAATDGATAISIAEREEIDFAFVDLTLRVECGVDVANSLEQVRDNIVVFLMSGSDHPSVVLRKPFLPETLEVLIED